MDTMRSLIDTLDTAITVHGLHEPDKDDILDRAMDACEEDGPGAEKAMKRVLTMAKRIASWTKDPDLKDAIAAYEEERSQIRHATTVDA
jgi:hypothetical protein